ncbi:MAG: TIGR04211 family SH3 domain-containing protein [Desulfobacula sp.]|uniref:TIGR04211 family SH3 domain-containing protein n=1 Tax=Desulfobacula sp. TaxID=2593537 RepID=UPI0025C61CB2|nr:TIGR04211 family SH3 domain-containing protein [Desulfobacula sp.]MCD4719648.1 TIGR04211 family SH3 domain-containing protein [Desulfobacula sp.]
MRKLLFHLMIFIMTICLFPQLSFAKTGYVSDMLLLTFRQGPGNSYAVIKTLKSNTPVSILEEENEFYKVELRSKEIGWVDKKFIIFELPKNLIIDQLKQENKTLENKISKLESLTQTIKDKINFRESEYSQKNESLETSLKTALDEKERLSSSLSDSRGKYNTLIEQSRNIQKIVKENKILQEKSSTLSKELEILKTKNKDLFKTGMIKWFLSGVGVLLIGWVIGQSVSSKKRGSSSLLG